MYIEDFVNAFITAAKSGKVGEVYCCGGTEYLKMKDLMIKLCDAMGKDPQSNIEVVERPVDFLEIKEQYIDATKLRSIGWTPKFSLDEGIAKSMEYYLRLAKGDLNQNQESEGSLEEGIRKIVKKCIRDEADN